MSKRIPNPPEVCSLDGAVCPGISSPHRYYATCPVIAGVQPCLLEITQPDGRISLEDAVTVLPSDAPYLVRDKGQPNYGNFLSLIEYDLRDAIAELQVTNEWAWATNSSYTKPPFRTDQYSSLLDAIERFLQTARNNLPSTLQPAAAMLANARDHADVWFLDHKFARVVQDRRRENWKIIERWPDWDRRKLRSWNRLLEYLADLNEPEPTNIEESEKALESFKQRYLFLRLKLPVEYRSKRRDLQREWAKRGWWKQNKIKLDIS